MADSEWTKMDIDNIPKPQQKKREFKVATFYDPKDNLCKSKIAVYTRDYNEKWSGCKMYTIEAVSGNEAKKQAQLKRFLYETKCEQCECKDTPNNPVTLKAHPYALEICGDDTPVWLCDDCRRSACRDI